MRQLLMGWTCAFAVAALSTAILGVAQTSGDIQKEAWSFSGETHTYSLFAPTSSGDPAPVLLLLHGSGQDSGSFLERWKELAQKEGMILVAPDSTDPNDWDFRKDSADSLHALLEQVESKHSVDRRRVYVFGESVGGSYALYLSIVQSEYFAATAIRGGFLPENNFKLIDTAKRKIPISVWAGTEDTVFPISHERAMRDAFNARGFTMELHELPGSASDATAGEVHGAAWEFLKTNKLETEPVFHELTQLLFPLVRTEPGKPSNPDLALTPEAFDRSVWAEAKPYVDGPLAQLTAEVVELQGLEPAPDQQPLAGLLKSVGEKSLELLKRMPNVTSHENVTTKVEPKGPTWHEQFEYLVLRHDAKSGVTLDEYRTDKQKTGATPLSQGAANSWVLFHPGNLVESRFRYLGRQRMDGHATAVVAFAQIPDKVRFPGYVSLHGATVPVLVQGVAWIDESDFRIVRLRTDLLAARPDISLRKLTSEIEFTEVRVPEATDPLWLPLETKITWDFKGEVVQQVHRYSGFKLYRSKVRLVM